MTYEEERQALAQPLIDAALGIPVILPGIESEPPQMSGDPSAPTRFIQLDVAYPGAEYLTFDGTKQVSGILELSCFIEPIAGDQPMRELIDQLEAAYKAADVPDLVFQTPQAAPDEFGEDGGWTRWDWRLPFWRFQ